MFIGAVHVDTIKAAFGDVRVFEDLIKALEYVAGKGEIEITHKDFACCDAQCIAISNGYTMDQINHSKAMKPNEGANITGKPENQLANAWTAQQFSSVLMSPAYALLTRFNIGVHTITLSVRTLDAIHAEMTEEGDVDGKGLRGVYVDRIGRSDNTARAPCHFLDVIVGSVKK